MSKVSSDALACACMQRGPGVGIFISLSVELGTALAYMQKVCTCPGPRVHNRVCQGETLFDAVILA